MRNVFISLRAPVIISSILVLPFIILEFMFQIVNRPGALNPQNILSLSVLFGLLWLLPIAFIIILMPIVRDVRAGNTLTAQPILLLFRVVLLAVIAMFWGGILIDQFPCFIGVPNCD
ncbi:MAG: hypothetical protein ACT4QE_22665 [Anaerolineales bacterium]